MISMTFRPFVTWPYADTIERRNRHTFKVDWSDTLRLLERELGNIGAFHIVIQTNHREGEIKLDGMPRADARVPQHPGVILSFESEIGPLRYATDAHETWQHNTRGIALGLEALRAVDRYGITRDAEQYSGWKQLTAGSSVTTEGVAKALLLRLSGLAAIADEDSMRIGYRLALKKAHPDHHAGGGSSELLAAVRDAGRVLGLRGKESV